MNATRAAIKGLNLPLFAADGWAITCKKAFNLTLPGWGARSPKNLPHRAFGLVRSRYLERDRFSPCENWAMKVGAGIAAARVFSLTRITS